jgi:hypothetical protein
MNELTAEKIRLVTLTVAAMRLTGRLDESEVVSQRQMERISQDLGHPVSARDIARLEQRAMHKARLALLAIQADQVIQAAKDSQS